MELEAPITKRGQTTVPAAVRKALRVGNNETIVYRVEDSGRVTLARKEEAETDPVITNFLAFLERDMRANPSALRPVTAEWLHGMQTLVEGVEIDLDAPLSDDDE
jgi:antitoxin PrlF